MVLAGKLPDLVLQACIACWSFQETLKSHKIFQESFLEANHQLDQFPWSFSILPMIVDASNFHIKNLSYLVNIECLLFFYMYFV